MPCSTIRQGNSLGIILLKLKEGSLIQGHELPEEVKHGLENALEEEMRKEGH